MTAVPRFAALPARAHWRAVDFISDLHLKADEPRTFDAWAAYLGRTRADAVFILGDLFEVWVGDDSAVPDSFEARCGDVLHAASQRLDVLFMHGNRDFLVGPDFLARCGVQLLADPTVLSLGGARTLLTHGDLLCTADAPYQQFRRQVRDPVWQQAFLARPLPERQAIARQMRAHSEQRHAGTETYADVDDALALQWLRTADAPMLIHGHTHRPAEHALDQQHQRVVLTDWHVADDAQRLGVLRLDAEGPRRLDPVDT